LEINNEDVFQEGQKARTIILVVEDDHDERKYLIDKLMDKFDVISAKDGMEGIKKAKLLMPDLIISDIKMPEMDGFGFFERLRKDAVTSHIPFIFLTGSNSEEDALKGLRIGADDYIHKPFKFSYLLARILNLCEKSRKLREHFDEILQLNPEEISSKDKEFYETATEIVTKNLANESFDIHNLCTDIGMSRTQLFRKFKALTGGTPNTFIRQIRLRKAAALLEKSDLNVTEICYEVGYKYPGHFTQHFKKQYGLSPKEYKKNKINSLSLQ
jgi:YesN/AraC family two-component response regulator